MTRRALWTVAAGIIALLVLASQAPSLVSRLRADTTIDATVRSLSARLPLGPRVRVSVALALVLPGLVALGWGWRRRVRRSRAAAPDDPIPFASVLGEAIDRRRTAPSPRHRMVTELAESGQGVAEIARATRLSQDAVRSLIAARSDSDRHELPPHLRPNGDGR